MLDVPRFNGRYKGFTAVVFGGAGALGRCVCRQLFAGGARVIAFDRNGEGLTLVKESLVSNYALMNSPYRGVFEHFELDMLPDESVETLRAEIEKRTSKVHMLICVAGGVVGADNVPFPDLATLRASWEQNFLTVPKVMLALLDLLERGKGAVAVTSSVNAVSGIGQMAYSSAKAALHAVVQDFAVTFGHLGMRANAVVLGTAVDPASPNPRWAKAIEGNPQLLATIGARFPRPRSEERPVPHPEEAANILCYVASPEASMINGAVLLADAGWMPSIGLAANAETVGAWFKRVESK